MTVRFHYHLTLLQIARTFSLQAFCWATWTFWQTSLRDTVVKIRNLPPNSISLEKKWLDAPMKDCSSTRWSHFNRKAHHWLCLRLSRSTTLSNLKWAKRVGRHQLVSHKRVVQWIVITTSTMWVNEQVKRSQLVTNVKVSNLGLSGKTDSVIDQNNYLSLERVLLGTQCICLTHF